LNKNVNLKKVIDELYNTFKEQKILEIESNNLESKYDDFRLLYNEYHDGILMYQLQKEKVWDKAVLDTIGLNKFYQKNTSNYMWENRISIKIYSAKNDKIKQKVLRKLKWGFDDEELLKEINKNSVLNLSIEELICGKGDNSLVDKSIFNLEDFDFNSLKAGDTYAAGTDQIILIKDILPRSVKSLNEIKGIVISDYQSFLEKQWIDELRQKYNIIINEELLLLVKNQELKITSDEANKNVNTQLKNISFQNAFINASQELGNAKDVYFGWNRNIYNTELKPHVED
jgi:peptidyl-prolyl cis-trans isomerase SurA